MCVCVCVRVRVCVCVYYMCIICIIFTRKRHYFQNGVYSVLFPNLKLFNLKLIQFYCD